MAVCQTAASSSSPSASTGRSDWTMGGRFRVLHNEVYFADKRRRIVECVECGKRVTAFANHHLRQHLQSAHNVILPGPGKPMPRNWKRNAKTDWTLGGQFRVVQALAKTTESGFEHILRTVRCTFCNITIEATALRLLRKHTTTTAHLEAKFKSQIVTNTEPAPPSAQANSTKPPERKAKSPKQRKKSPEVRDLKKSLRSNKSAPKNSANIRNFMSPSSSSAAAKTPEPEPNSHSQNSTDQESDSEVEWDHSDSEDSAASVSDEDEENSETESAAENQKTTEKLPNFIPLDIFKHIGHRIEKNERVAHLECRICQYHCVGTRESIRRHLHSVQHRRGPAANPSPDKPLEVVKVTDFSETPWVPADVFSLTIEGVHHANGYTHPRRMVECKFCGNKFLADKKAVLKHLTQIRHLRNVKRARMRAASSGDEPGRLENSDLSVDSVSANDGKVVFDIGEPAQLDGRASTNQQESQSLAGTSKRSDYPETLPQADAAASSQQSSDQPQNLSANTEGDDEIDEEADYETESDEEMTEMPGFARDLPDYIPWDIFKFRKMKVYKAQPKESLRRGPHLFPYRIPHLECKICGYRTVGTRQGIHSHLRSTHHRRVQTLDKPMEVIEVTDFSETPWVPPDVYSLTIEGINHVNGYSYPRRVAECKFCEKKFMATEKNIDRHSTAKAHLRKVELSKRETIDPIDLLKEKWKSSDEFRLFTEPEPTLEGRINPKEMAECLLCGIKISAKSAYVVNHRRSWAHLQKLAELKGKRLSFSEKRPISDNWAKKALTSPSTTNAQPNVGDEEVQVIGDSTPLTPIGQSGASKRPNNSPPNADAAKRSRPANWSDSIDQRGSDDNLPDVEYVGTLRGTPKRSANTAKTAQRSCEAAQPAPQQCSSSAASSRHRSAAEQSSSRRANSAQRSAAPSVSEHSSSAAAPQSSTDAGQQSINEKVAAAEPQRYFQFARAQNQQMMLANSQMANVGGYPWRPDFRRSSIAPLIEPTSLDRAKPNRPEKAQICGICPQNRCVHQSQNEQMAQYYAMAQMQSMMATMSQYGIPLAGYSQPPNGQPPSAPFGFGGFPAPTFNFFINQPNPADVQPTPQPAQPKPTVKPKPEIVELSSDEEVQTTGPTTRAMRRNAANRQTCREPESGKIRRRVLIESDDERENPNDADPLELSETATPNETAASKSSSLNFSVEALVAVEEGMADEAPNPNADEFSSPNPAEQETGQSLPISPTTAENTPNPEEPISESPSLPEDRQTNPELPEAIPASQQPSPCTATSQVDVEMSNGDAVAAEATEEQPEVQPIEEEFPQPSESGNFPRNAAEPTESSTSVAECDPAQAMESIAEMADCSELTESSVDVGSVEESLSQFDGNSEIGSEFEEKAIIDNSAESVCGFEPEMEEEPIAVVESTGSQIEITAADSSAIDTDAVKAEIEEIENSAEFSDAADSSSSDSAEPNGEEQQSSSTDWFRQISTESPPMDSAENIPPTGQPNHLNVANSPQAGDSFHSLVVRSFFTSLPNGRLQCHRCRAEFIDQPDEAESHLLASHSAEYKTFCSHLPKSRRSESPPASESSGEESRSPSRSPKATQPKRHHSHIRPVAGTARRIEFIDWSKSKNPPRGIQRKNR